MVRAVPTPPPSPPFVRWLEKIDSERANVGALSQVSIQRLRAVLGDDTFALRFTVEGEVGRGGMGSVHRAFERESKLPVAIKVLHATAHQARFALEAETLERLSHPAIVAYVGHGVTRDGDAYLAMAWIDGESLAERLARGPLSIADTLAAGIRIAGALAHAHAEGIVHRDIKPSNVMLVDKDPRRATLIDFGIAKDTASTQGLTETGQLVGTPGYMSPEQAMGTATLDARTDMFAFGALLYHALTGTPPFEGKQPMEVLAQLLLRDPPPVRELRPEVHERLSTLVSALLVKEPDKRMADAAGVEAELLAISNAIASADTATLSASSPLHVVVDAGAPTKLERPPKPRQRPIALIAAASGIAVAGIAVFVVARRDAPPTNQPVAHPVEASDAVTIDAKPPRIHHDCERTPGACDRACDAGDGYACQLAYGDAILAAGRDNAKIHAAIAIAEKGCTVGDGRSCGLAGLRIHSQMRRGDKSFTRERWFSLLDRGCTVGDSSSCSVLGSTLVDESPANFVQALAYQERACDLERNTACTLAATMHLGRNEPGDAERAAELRALACKRGFESACKP